MRRRADALNEELAASRREIQQRTEEEIALLRERVALAGEEGRAVLDQLRGGQDEAAANWTAATEELKVRLSQAIMDISRVDSASLEQARRRLESLGAEAERVDIAMAERLTAFEQGIARRREDAEARESEALTALENRLAALDENVRQRQEEHLAHVAGLTERGNALAARLGELSAQMEQIAAQGGETGGELKQAAAGLAASLAETRAELDNNSDKIAQLTDESVRLLELVRAGAEHTQRDLPRALADAASRTRRFPEQDSGRAKRHRRSCRARRGARQTCCHRQSRRLFLGRTVRRT